jgi:hypothetical protein
MFMNNIVKTRLKLYRLSVTCCLRHPIRHSQFSLFLENYRHIMPTPSRKSRSSHAHLLFDYRNQHQVESSCSFRVVVLASVLVDCCLPLSYHVLCSPCSRSLSAFVFSNWCSDGPALASFYSHTYRYSRRTFSHTELSVGVHEVLRWTQSDYWRGWKFGWFRHRIWWDDDIDKTMASNIVSASIPTTIILWLIYWISWERQSTTNCAITMAQGSGMATWMNPWNIAKTSKSSMYGDAYILHPVNETIWQSMARRIL